MRIDATPISLEDQWMDIFRECGRPIAILACTYTFNSEFFQCLRDRFADAVCEGVSNDTGGFAHVPIDVVCDRNGYRGHRLGFNVSFWHNSRLFHPKLLIVLFPEEVVWSDGSLNLTLAGWHCNREIAMIHRPHDMTIPRALRELLESMPKTTASKLMLSNTSCQRNGNPAARFVTSLKEPLGERFLAGAPRHAEEVHLVAPFFEKNESAGITVDERWLETVALRYSDSDFHIYLPTVKDSVLRVQGNKGMFSRAQRCLSSGNIFKFHPVEWSPGPLHGKVACVVYRQRREMLARLMVGSPNMTKSALLTPGENIETAWFLDEDWSAIRPLIRKLGAKWLRLNDVTFEDQSTNALPAWMPLRSASYDPLQRVLNIEWKNPVAKNSTVLRYAGNPLKAKDGCTVKGFSLVDGIAWIVARRIHDGAEGLCPIEVPVDTLPACDQGAPCRSPEEWLMMLGSIISNNQGGVQGTNSLSIHDGQKDIKSSFEYSERVRDLATRMRYLEGELCEEGLNSVQRDWLIKLAEQIHKAHDPSCSQDPQEQVWRTWVRLELWQTAVRLSTRVRQPRDRSFWRKRAASFRRLGMQTLPEPIKKQYLAAIRGLREEI